MPLRARSVSSWRHVVGCPLVALCLVSRGLLAPEAVGEDVRSLREAAHLGVHEETVRRWAREGAIPAVKLGNRGGFRFRREDLDRFPEERRAEVHEAHSWSPSGPTGRSANGSAYRCRWRSASSPRGAVPAPDLVGSPHRADDWARLE